MQSVWDCILHVNRFRTEKTYSDQLQCNNERDANWCIYNASKLAKYVVVNTER